MGRLHRPHRRHNEREIQMADENARYFYHQAVGNNPGLRQITANTVLWDSNDGTPFLLPPGRSPTYYVAKGFKAYPPEGFAPNKDLHLVQPLEPMRGEPWTPRREKSDIQRGLEVILAAQAAEDEKKNALANAVARNQDKLAAALEVIAANSEPVKNKGGRPRKNAEMESAEA